MNINDEFFKFYAINKAIAAGVDEQIATCKDYTFERIYEHLPATHVPDQLNNNLVLSYATAFTNPKVYKEWLGFPEPESYEIYNYGLGRQQNKVYDVMGTNVSVKDFRPYISKF